MADTAVEFLLGNLKQLLVYNVELIRGVKDQVEALCNDLRMLAAFVKDATPKSKEYEVVKELVRQIRTAVYEAEDAVDAYVVHTAVQRARSSIQRAYHILDYPAKLRSIAKEMEPIRVKVKGIYDNKLFGFEALQAGETSKAKSPEKRPPIVEEDNVVGFDVEAKTIIDRLIGGGDELEVVSVIGMGGLGKTTLAKKVFNDSSIQFEFFIRGWVYVSQVYTRREVFLGILRHVTQVNNNTHQMSDDALAEILHKHLQGGRYLIVMDDVWTKDAWDDLKMAFPNEGRSRILLTSRNRDVAVHANDIDPHQLRFLTKEESRELLEKKVFRKGKFPSDLEVYGKQIAEKCYGLPLAIVVVAGILVKRNTSSWWEQVAKSVSSYVAMDSKQCMDVLALSFNHLPYHLKACFLYFGVFPEDFEVPVWVLKHLWVAEGFIQRVGDVILEDIAEENLEDLVDRNLVLVERRRSNGRIKTCRIHDMLHELCVKEGKEENFFREICLNSSSSFTSSNIYRRLCIHSQVSNYISSKPSGSHVRSFLCFATDEMVVLPPEHISFIPTAFKLLRVLDIRQINFCRFPGELIQLVHLRYIALLGHFKVLPKATSNLWNLQTLIFQTTERSLNIEADIWNMLHLRHLYTSGSSCLPSPPAKARKGNEDPLVRGNLQTICTISPNSCAENIFIRTPNLKKLGIRGKLVTLVEEKGGSSRFGVLAKLDHLETLKLWNDTYPDPPSKDKLLSLPQWYKFPPKLKKLTLSDTLLNWEQMSILGMLTSLEVLKLRENAFTGQRWEPLDGGFPQLKVLQICRTDLVHWEASGYHFPRLQRVILRHCQSLKEIPSGLGDVSELQTMELYWPTDSAAASARLIQQRQQQSQGEQGIVKKGLKLTIYPPSI